MTTAPSQSTADPHLSSSLGLVPTAQQAEGISRELLSDIGTRWPHVRTAGQIAQSIAYLFPPDEGHLLVAAATLHDIGYAPKLAKTGFHPLDGAVFLRDSGYSVRLARLVANHSHAELMAPDHGLQHYDKWFPREDSLLADALTFADMHASPDGPEIDPETRLADIERRHGNAGFEVRERRLRASIARVTRLKETLASRS